MPSASGRPAPDGKSHERPVRLFSSYWSRGAHMTRRALAVWCLLLLLAVLNGGGRGTWLSPPPGGTIGWIRPTSSRAALGVGAVWVVLTLAFEFGVGHYGFGKPWSELLADYDLS